MRIKDQERLGEKVRRGDVVGIWEIGISDFLYVSYHCRCKKHFIDEQPQTHTNHFKFSKSKSL